MKIRNNMAKVLAVGLVLSQTFTAFAADLPTNTSVSSETNAASGDTKVILDNKYWYKVQLPGIIDLKFDETTQSYKDEFDINVSGQASGKMLQIDTNNVEMTGTDNITVENYVGQYDKGEKNHTYVYGSGEGDTELTPEWAAIKSGASHSAYGIKAGNYDGTADYKFKLVDADNGIDNQIIETGQFLGMDYRLADLDDDGTAETCLLSGTQTEARASNDKSAPYLKEGVTDVVFDNAILSDGSRLFYDVKNLKSITGNVDTSKVTSMRSMFNGSSATTIDVSNFDTSNVTDMNSMFSSAKATTLDVSNFNTSNVTSMGYMFCDSSATTLDLSNFDTSNVTNMDAMFGGSKATTLDLSNFDTSNVTSMGSMFYDSSATTLDVSNFDTSKVTNMYSMFRGLPATTIDVSSFDTSKVTNMSNMFYNSKATTIKIFKTIGSKVANLPSGTWLGSDGKTYTQITTPGIILTKQ